MSDNSTSTDTIATSFLKFASLDQRGFFSALEDAGFPNMAKNPLANFVFSGLATSNAGGVPLDLFEVAIDTAIKARKLYLCHVTTDEDNKELKGVTHTGFTQMGLEFLGMDSYSVETGKIMFPEVRQAILRDATSTSTRRSMFVRSMIDAEAFGRYNFNKSGYLDESELLVFTFALQILCRVFNSSLEHPDDDGLTRQTYPIALKQIGVACLARTFQGQFMDSVYSRTDRSDSGSISFSEFVKAGMSLIYPASHHSYIAGLDEYPGWPELSPANGHTEESIQSLVQRIATLNTGDVILMQDAKGPMGQFINFSLNSPWTHCAVIVKRSPLSPQSNEKTEELLQTYPFRRLAHQFCSPGYCRCLDTSEGDFPPSQLTGLGHVGLLESTGEGIHLYDAAHRLLEYGNKRWTSIAIARLHNAPGRDDTARINAFVESVRGGIYSVAKDELKAAIAYHTLDHDENNKATNSGSNNQEAQLQFPPGARGSDDFCASIVQRFYHHMGWVGDNTQRPFNSVMPSDFDVFAQVNGMNGTRTCPVELLEGKGWLGTLELVTCPDLNAQLPLKLPKHLKKMKKTKQ